MKKKIWIILIIALIFILSMIFLQINQINEDLINDIGTTEQIELGFCGWDTEDTCERNADCVRAGGSEEVCAHVDKAHLMQTTGYIDCYEPETYGVECGCFDNMCQWQ